MRAFILLTSVLFLTSACTSTSHSPLNQKSQIYSSALLRLDGIQNQETHSVYSSSLLKVYQDNQIQYERSEAVELTTLTEILPRDIDSFFMTVKTLSKDGPIPLASLAYPEVDEQLDYIILKDSTVIKAGGFPQKSLYFIPQLPLPNKELKKGETWLYSHSWLSDDTFSMIKLEIILILKNIFSCDKSMCIEVEYSGDMAPQSKPDPQLQLKSKLSGKMIFDLTRAQVVSSYQSNEEELIVEGSVTQSRSCSVTYSSQIQKKPTCSP